MIWIRLQRYWRRAPIQTLGCQINQNRFHCILPYLTQFAQPDSCRRNATFAEAPENVFQCQEELPCLSIQLAWPLDVSLVESATRPANGTIDIFTFPVKAPPNMVLTNWLRQS